MAQILLEELAYFDRKGGMEKDGGADMMAGT